MELKDNKGKNLNILISRDTHMIKIELDLIQVKILNNNKNLKNITGVKIILIRIKFFLLLTIVNFKKL